MRTITLLLLVLVAGLVVAGSAGAEEPAPTRLEQAMANPPATGLLVTDVAEGTQAASLGIQAGDIIVTYDGNSTSSLGALRQAINGAAGQTEVKLLVVQPGGKEATFMLAPGRIGVVLTPARKGVKIEPVPADTGVRFDFSRLEGAPRDDWYAFALPGVEGKSGFEHGVAKLEDGKLVVRREVAFDGGERYGGLNHMDVTVTLAAEPSPRIVSWRIEVPHEGFSLEARLEVDEAGKQTLHAKRENQSGEPNEETTRIEDGPPLVPSYVVETLAGFMPREKGASFRFRLVHDSSGQIMGEQALFCAGEETLEIAGASVKAFKYEQRRLGGTAATFWVDVSGGTVKSDYNGATATRVTKEEAVKDLPDSVVPRSAD